MNDLTKLVYILWAPHGMTPERVRAVLLDHCSPQLLERGAHYLQCNIADERVGATSPAPQTPLSDEPFVAQVNVWLRPGTPREPLEDVLRTAGFDIAGYRVRESLYTEYGDNQHGRPRSWPDGERSPYIVAVTLLERPTHIPRDEWQRRWFGRQSPMSEAMQPRARYVRHVVDEVLTPGAFPYEGIVEESWPSAQHIQDPFLFYGAKNVVQLLRNIGVMLSSVMAFLPLTRIPNVMTSEYFVRSPFATSGVSSPADERGASSHPGADGRD
ncbi:MAG: hypothetical protein R3B40_13075 [Polyangiales bacterium]|nr:hypothetical protein [Myxococcales bacterium]